MIVLTIKIKTENSTHTKKEFLNDDYIVSKQNPKLQELVEKAVKESAFEGIDEVTVIAKFEW